MMSFETEVMIELDVERVIYFNNTLFVETDYTESHGFYPKDDDYRIYINGIEFREDVDVWVGGK